MASYAINRVKDHYPDLTVTEITERLHYATFVNFERRYMYFAVPKAGCTTIKTMIHRLENLPPIPSLSGRYREVRRDMFIHAREFFKLKSLRDFDDQQQEEILSDPDFFRFTVVRNPYTRLQSSWKDKVRPCAPGYEYLYKKIKKNLPTAGDASSLIDFHEFVEEVARENLRTCNRHWRMQTHHTLSNALNYSLVGRIEQLEDCLSTFTKRAGYPTRPQMNGMNHSPPFRSSYDEKLAKRIYKLYEPDFRRFNYDQDSWHTTATAPGGGRDTAQIGEIIERNLIIGDLYRERDELVEIKKPTALEHYRRNDFETIYQTQIAAVDGWFDKAALLLLYDTARQIADGCIVEIGSFRGRSTMALAAGSAAGANVPVYAVEPHEPAVGPFGSKFGSMDRGHFMQTLLKFGLFHIVRLLNVSSIHLGKQWPLPVRLLWFDGDLQYNQLKADVDHWWNKLADDAVIIVNMGSPLGQKRLIDELLASKRISRAQANGTLMVLYRSKSSTAAC